MGVTGIARVACPACGREHDAKLVQSINTRQDADAKQKLVAGELNLLVCDCGKRTQLAADLLYYDPDRDYYCRVITGGAAAIAEADALFAAAGAIGTQRLVPSINALVEKVKLLDAGLEDWAIEMTKVLLLASLGDGELGRVMLFDRLDGDLLHWVLFDEHGRAPRPMASPRAQYDKLVVNNASRPAPSDRQIDRAWAVTAVSTMIAKSN